jgi:hypothetical protein
MSNEYAGDPSSFPATITMLENGEPVNEASLVDEMMEPLADRTAYLKSHLDSDNWVNIKSTASGGSGTLAIQADRGVASVAYGGPSGTIDVTMDAAYADLFIVTSGGAFKISTPAVQWGVVGVPQSTTVVRLYLTKHDGTAPDYTTDTIEIQARFVGNSP